MSKKGEKEAPRFEAALERMENEDRPEDYPGLTPEHRTAASTSQFSAFVARYWPDWRHSKVRAYRYLLEDRERLLDRERERFERGGHHAETLIYQEMTNGLIASALSEVCQYAEDLSALAFACESDEFFVQRLGTRAGPTLERVKKWEHVTSKEAARVLRIPFYPQDNDWDENDPIVQSYVLGMRRARERLRAIGRFYRQSEVHFMRYKHGLLLGLKEIPEDEQSAEFLESRRGSLAGRPIAFDTSPISQAIDKDGQPGLIVANIADDHVRLNAAKLAADRNLLRLVLPRPLGSEPHIKTFEEIASWISQLQRVLLRNRTRELTLEPVMPYHMPAERADETLAMTTKE